MACWPIFWVAASWDAVEIIEPTAAIELLKDGDSLDRLAKAIERTRQDPKKRDKTPPAIDIDVVVRGLSAKVLQSQAQDPLVVIPPFDWRLVTRRLRRMRRAPG